MKSDSPFSESTHSIGSSVHEGEAKRGREGSVGFGSTHPLWSLPIDNMNWYQFMGGGGEPREGSMVLLALEVSSSPESLHRHLIKYQFMGGAKKEG